IAGFDEKDYMESIIPSSAAQQKDVLDAKFGEGRSGAFFYFTHDSRFLVKTISKSECEFFVSILKKYVEFLHDNPDSALNLFVGLHSCRMYNLTLYFVVMENIFLADLKPHETYDLKGSWIARYTHAGINSGKVMKDMDLNRYIVLSKESKEKILEQLEKDSLFLRDTGIMDYSLLLGIYYMQIAHNPPRNSRGFVHRARTTEPSKNSTNAKETENLLNDFHGGVRAQVIEGPGIYYIGIIDILQKWNISKKMEHYFKCWVLRNPSDGISCVEPVFYQQRFMEYMRRIMITDEEFLELNSVSTEMFHEAVVLQYPAPAKVDDSFRSRGSTLQIPHSSSHHSPKHSPHIDEKSSASDVQVAPSNVISEERRSTQKMMDGTHQKTSFRRTYRLHRGNSSGHVLPTSNDNAPSSQKEVELIENKVEVVEHKVERVENKAEQSDLQAVPALENHESVVERLMQATVTADTDKNEQVASVEENSKDVHAPDNTYTQNLLG
ncbi:hypothetical protein RFI_05418, partial [Reticulomyxa filosa]